MGSPARVSVASVFMVDIVRDVLILILMGLGGKREMFCVDCLSSKCDVFVEEGERKKERKARMYLASENPYSKT